MLIAVKDACVLIDLANGKLVGRWFQLQIETHTTDAVLYEVEDEAQHQEINGFVEAGMIHVSPMFESGGFEELQAITDVGNEMGVSVPDASAFLLAEKLDAVLLTGDGDLRKQATARGVTVCGVLWVLDMLLWEDVIDFGKAISSLQEMLDHGARLPAKECRRRTQAWEDEKKIRPREV